MVGLDQQWVLAREGTGRRLVQGAVDRTMGLVAETARGSPAFAEPGPSWRVANNPRAHARSHLRRPRLLRGHPPRGTILRRAAVDDPGEFMFTVTWGRFWVNFADVAPVYEGSVLPTIPEDILELILVGENTDRSGQGRGALLR